MYYDQGNYGLRCEWGLGGIEKLAAADVVVIVDVLSFTTSLDLAIARGAEVLPFRWKDGGVEEFAAKHRATLAARRLERDKVSLSPSSMKFAQVGERIVLPSQNGSTLTLAAARSDSRIFAACLRNFAAVAEAIGKIGGTVNVIPAGEKWSQQDDTLRPALEDYLGAGAVISALRGKRSPEAELAAGGWEAARGNVRRWISECASGRELLERGFEEDVALASELDSSRVVPVFEKGKYVDRMKKS